jgi:hypothetical protein
MERGIYFDAWFPDQYCYHPSLPPRRLKMVDDIEAMRGTMLVWAGLGGGSISLPYLEGEAFGEVPERFRQYGFVNDSEFIAHCRERGIDLFGIVFEAQGWEFPAEVADGRVLALNEPRGAADRSWLGLREFTQDRGPANWKPFRHYFPDGLVNSDGEEVTDLWEECCSRDLYGRPLHAHWVEVGATGQQVYFMDRNNPVWRQYLKAICRIQIDAGVAGVQLDETCTPMSALRYGGCFCKDCVKGFRAYLRGLSSRPAELDGLDLDTFDYRAWLVGQGYKPGDAPQTLPLYQHYSRFLQLAIAETYRDIVDDARAYAAAKGQSLRIAGNFFDCAPYYDPLIEVADVVVTEMAHTRYQQPWWFRHGVGLSRGRPLVAVENPYGGMIPELLTQLQKGRGYDRFRLTIFEASAMGGNMTLPYGSWLGNEIEDSYYAPRQLARKTGRFLEEIDPLISPESLNETAVLYSIRSTARDAIDSDQFSDEGRFFTFEGDADAPPVSYWDVAEGLSRAGAVYDVVIAPDEELRPNDLTAAALAPYTTVVVPDCWALSQAQHEALMGYLDEGGRVLLHGAYGAELPPQQRESLLAHPGCTEVGDVAELPGLIERQVVAELGPECAVNLHRLDDGGAALHIVNYAYDEAADRVTPHHEVPVRVRVAGRSWSHAVLHAPGSDPVPLDTAAREDGCEFTVPVLRTYAVVHLS